MLKMFSSLSGHPKLKPSIVKNGYPAKSETTTRDPDRLCAHRLKEKCEEKTKELLFIREEFKKASCAFVVFAVTTQYFFSKVRKPNVFAIIHVNCFITF